MPHSFNVPSGLTIYGTPRLVAQYEAGSAANENSA
jgi:hypothetical protein